MYKIQINCNWYDVNNDSDVEMLQCMSFVQWHNQDKAFGSSLNLIFDNYVFCVILLVFLSKGCHQRTGHWDLQTANQILLLLSTCIDWERILFKLWTLEF